MRSVRLVAAGFLALIAASASAGERNTIVLRQEAPETGLGNRLFIDQSEATGSRVGGSLADPALPARQTGGGNEAGITLAGEDAVVALRQTTDRPAFDETDRNLATIVGGGFADIVVEQTGLGNIGTVEVGPGSVDRRNLGRLLQDGNGNVGTVFVEGTGAEGILEQIGDENAYTLDVVGTDTSVRYRQEGDNLTPTQPLQVISNARTVEITQSRF